MNIFTKDEVLNKILKSEKLSLEKGDILSITEQQGGLLNYVFRIETSKGLFFLKQFLKELKHEIFKGLENAPTGRINLSYDAENIFENLIKAESLIPHIHEYNQEDGYLIIEGFADVAPLLDKIKVGDFSKNYIKELAPAIATVHQKTYENHNGNKKLYNIDFLNLKLKYQYYEIAKMIDSPNEARTLNDFADGYKNKKNCLVHGDLCSINILLSKNDKIHLIDFEDSHIGHPAFDLGYLLSEFFVARINFPEQATNINNIMREFLDEYFKIFDKENRDSIEIEITLHAASLIIYRAFGLSKDSFTSYIKDEKVKDDIKKYAVSMISNHNQPINYFLN